MVKPNQEWPRPDDNVTVVRELETVTITSPVTATVKAQIEAIMKVVDLVKVQGKRSIWLNHHTATVSISTTEDLHPRTLELLKAVGISIGEKVPALPVATILSARRDKFHVQLVW